MDDYGRSTKISKSILKCIKSGYINSVSVMMGFTNLNTHKELLKTKIKTKLHINLTENSQIYFRKKKKLKNLNFLSLLFADNNMKTVLKKRIDVQIEKYISIFGTKNLGIDGHEHVHIIPWVHNYIMDKKNIFIKEIRYPNEKINVYGYKNLFKIKFYRNLIALILVKFLILFLKKKKKSPIFFGLLYSGMYNKKILKENIAIIDKNKQTEILIHGGFTDNSERKFFEQKYFNHYSSKSNKIEHNLAFSNILKKINS